MDLVTFDTLKSVLGLDGASIADYPALAVIQSSVTAAIESHLGRALEYGKRAETIELDELTTMLPLRALPVKALTSVTVRPFGSTTTQTLTTVEPASFGARTLAPVSGRITVVYSGGLTAVPDWLQRAALIQTVYEFQNKDHMGAESVSIDGGSVQRPALGLLKEVRRLLDPHRHPFEVVAL